VVFILETILLGKRKKFLKHRLSLLKVLEI